MGEIRMTAEIRTDYDCEVTALPADRWAEAVFKIFTIFYPALSCRLACLWYRYVSQGLFLFRHRGNDYIYSFIDT